MEPNREEVANYLLNWINKAVTNGGFNAQEAASAINALNTLAGMAQMAQDGQTPVKGSPGEGTSKKSG